ncbi:hypothetical protein HUT18_00025 [Streptomyces sp. NA04227]|uniref:hypothetical protein n=1 Tax=Streptomyces sp. NA04227 TaxID=2742136 RepID=UPI0015929D2D|nr:hypothetical protein [Streptomyces sp. NA04227]QKW04981.1 hypothetical protein HUT18_00025 [Streptomyces sp. NA04227]
MADIRTVHGRVKADGSKANDKQHGFSVEKTATGTYKISFDDPFTIEPSVVATVYGTNADGSSQNTVHNAVVEDVGRSDVRIITGDYYGAKADRAFSFIAISGTYSRTPGPDGPV